MAEAPGGEPVPCCSDAADTAAVEAKSDDAASSPKKRKIAGEGEPSEKLEQRLGGILCCSVCLDLPQAAVYQCTNGHLMCAPCFTHLLADARLRDEPSTCPNCRVEISKACASRNLAVEKTVSELPSECKHCAQVFPRHSLQHHEEVACCDRQFKFSQIVVGGCVAAGRGSLLAGLVRIVSGVSWAVAGALRRTYLTSGAGAAGAGAAGAGDTGAGRCKRRQYRRVTGCRYECIGCPWRGPWHEAGAHEAACARPARSARDVLGALDERDRRAADAHRMHQQLLDLLSYEKITFNDLQLKPYRTEEFVHKLYYETSRFTAFGHQWVVKAFVNKQQRDPTQSTQREITYQLILKSKPLLPGGGALGVQWVWLRGPWGEAGLRARVAAHAFAEDCADAPPLPLPLVDPNDANRLLSNKAIHFRLIMFLASK